MGQHLGVQRIGLGQPSSGLGEIALLPRIDHDHGQRLPRPRLMPRGASNSPVASSHTVASSKARSRSTNLGVSKQPARIPINWCFGTADARIKLHRFYPCLFNPDFNADEAIWGWARQEATANHCLGTRAAVQEQVGDFFARLSSRCEEVKRRCRTMLQAKRMN